MISIEPSAQERGRVTDAAQYLPFRNKTGAWRRITTLEDENQRVVATMRRLAEQYQSTITSPRDIYLSIQQVKSGTVYIRWRKKGVRGNQRYLLFNSNEGKAFLLRQSLDVRQLYQQFDTQAQALNLAYSLRINEIKRIRKYLENL